LTIWTNPSAISSFILHPYNRCTGRVNFAIVKILEAAMDIRSLRFHYAWVVLAMGTLVVAGALGMARFGYSVVLPAMKAGLGMDNALAGALATANLAGYLAMSLIGGAAASRLGPRRVISVGLAVAGAGMLLTGLARGFQDVAVGRFLTGLGSGASNVPVMALLSAWFAPRRRGFAAGIGVSGSSLALIMLGPLAPRVIAAYGPSGWRVCWFIFGGAALLLAVMSAVLLRNRPAELGLQPLGAEPEQSPAPQTSGGLDWGAVYRSWHMWHLGLVYIAFGFSYIIYMTFFVEALQSVGKYTPKEAGSLFMLMGWFSLLCGLIWGTLSDRIGRKHTLILLYLVHTCAFGLFALWPAPPGFTISAILFGLSAWSIPAIMAAASVDLLGARLAPAGLGFITLFFGIGQALGPYVAGTVADAAGSLLPAFLLAAGVAFLGAVGAAGLRMQQATR
jgi:predicted MFS family arabinose efflux permease